MKNTFLSRFTPSLMTSETLEALFVQRHQLVEDLIEVIRESALTKSKHFRLLVGGRGMGKTYTISLIYHRLSKMDDLKDKLLIAWMREEEWGISSFLDLLLRIFRALEKEYPEEYKAKLEREIKVIYELSADEACDRAVRLLKEFIGNRTLLLLMENLDDIFSGLGDIGQKQFRAYIQNYSFITILATTQCLFTGVKQKNSPFYGFFYPQYLELLELDEVIDLLGRIAKLEGKKDLEDFIQTPTGRDRIKAIHHLAGGNHRVYVIFAEFLTRKALDELVEPFMKTLDELTPYYQARMQWLSPQQRKIVDFLCDRRHPVMVKEIAQHCFITHQTASSQLKDLRNKGYVRVETIGRESFYDLQEVLMRYCLDVKKQRGEPISLFVDFLRCWYPKEELKKRWMKLSLVIPGIKDENNFIEPLDPILVSKKYYSHVLERQYIELALQKQKNERDPRIAAYWHEYKNCREKVSEPKSTEMALNYLDKLIVINNDDNSLLWVEKGNYLDDLGKSQEAIASFDRAIEINFNDYIAWHNRGITFGKLEKHREAITSFARAIEINPNDDYVWYNHGIALNNLGKYKEAIASFARAIEINPNDASVWYERGNVLNNLEKYNEAIISFNRSLEINPNDDSVWCDRGITLNNSEKYNEAIISFNRALEINPKNIFVCFFRSWSLLSLSRYEEAIANLDYILGVRDDFDFAASIWNIRTWLLIKLERYSEALESCERTFVLDKQNPLVFFNHVISLLGLNRWDESINKLKDTLDFFADRKKIASEEHIELIISILFNQTQDRKIWNSRIKTLLEIFDRHKVTSLLAQAIVKTIPVLMSEMTSDKAAQIWLETWQELTSDRPEFQIPLRFLNTAVRYKQTKGDRKVLLELAIEERTLLEPLLKQEHS